MPSQRSGRCRSKYSAMQSGNLEKMGKAYLAVFSILQKMESASSDCRAGISLPACFPAPLLLDISPPLSLEYLLALLRRAHPNDRMVEIVSSAHGAGSYFARGHMLAQFVLAARAASVCCAQHLLAEGNTRMLGMWKLPFPHAALPVSLSGSTCSHILCPPHALSLHTAL